VSPVEGDQLEANLLLLRDKQSNTTVLFVSVDCLYPGPRLRSALENSLSDLIDSDSIFLAGSHTHAAPNLDPTKPKLGYVVESHVTEVSNLIAKRAKALLTTGDYQEVVQRNKRFQPSGVITRRKIVPVTLRDFRLRFFESEFLPNPKRSPVVYSEIVEFVGKKGVVGAIWIMPCHPLTSPSAEKPSADYVGDVRLHYRENNPPKDKPPSMVFLQGASGDLRPAAFGLREWISARNVAINLLVGPTFRRFTGAECESWLAALLADFVSAEVIAAKELAVPRVVLSKLDSRRELFPLSHFYHSVQDGRQISLHRVRIGSFVILGVSAEPTWEFRQNIISQITGEFDAGSLVGCIDDTFGYLVSEKEEKYGGYEVRGFMRHFSVEQRPQKNTDESIRRRISRFLSRTQS